MVIIVKLIGALRHLSGKKQLDIDYQHGLSINKLIRQMSREFSGLKNLFSDQELNDSRSNALILVNGVEISALRGLKTELKDGDEIVFVPVVHGG
jgi:MoaD family protein